MSLYKLANGPGKPLDKYTWLVRTLFPFQEGNALPSSQPACLTSQDTSQVPSFFGTPTIGILTPRVGISRMISVSSYFSSSGCALREVLIPGAKPVIGIKKDPLPGSTEVGVGLGFLVGCGPGVLVGETPVGVCVGGSWGVLIGVCVAVGALVGVLVGIGVSVGEFAGVFVGVFVRALVGVSVGILVGICVVVSVTLGVSVGVFVGRRVGVTLGVSVGVLVGLRVGVFLGVLVGELVGLRVGVTLGVLVDGTGVVSVGV